MAVDRERSDRFTSRALRTLAAFGLTVQDVRLTASDRRRSESRAAAMAERVLDDLADGGLLLLTGPSGAGKSTLLGAVAELARKRRIAPVWSPEPAKLQRCRRRVVDIVATRLRERAGREPDRALTLLAACGLADARLAVMRADELSDGERARLALALGLAACEAESFSGRGVILLVDEFAASLDATTARGVASGLARRLHASNTAAVVATHREDLRKALTPSREIRLDAVWLGAPLEPRRAAA
jgi:ABC-type iron transport system FetAB ATPase subunit